VGKKWYSTVRNLQLKNVEISTFAVSIFVFVFVSHKNTIKPEKTNGLQRQRNDKSNLRVELAASPTEKKIKIKEKWNGA